MYKQLFTPKEIQKAIKTIKVFFETELGNRLNLTRVSAPLFVSQSTGLNDHLNEVERPVTFDALHIPDAGTVEIVHSLAKWKRMALGKYAFLPNEGLYTNMNAVRRDEKPDHLHSIYVDQWDFEKVIVREQRSLDYLKSQVNLIYSVFKDCETLLQKEYPFLSKKLPEEIFYITSEELLQTYPHLNPKERERAITKEKGAVFIFQIGKKLSNGSVHDLRAADYDDWELNGDLFFYNKVLDDAIELSSMGIRVDKESLLKQLQEKNQMFKTDFPFHKALLEDALPLSFGGGIGQSRICLFLLECLHIGEVQSSLWPQEMIEHFRAQGVEFL